MRPILDIITVNIFPFMDIFFRGSFYVEVFTDCQCIDIHDVIETAHGSHYVPEKWYLQVSRL